MPKRKQNMSPGCLNKCINNSLKGNMSCIQNQTIVHTLEKYKECFHHFRFYQTKRVKSEHNGQFSIVISQTSQSQSRLFIQDNDIIQLFHYKNSIRCLFFSNAILRCKSSYRV